MRKPATPEDTITQRHDTYGSFDTNAEIAQRLKDVVREFDGRLGSAHKESLDMIMTKVARILNGDANHEDSWHDIAGYAILAKHCCSPT